MAETVMPAMETTTGEKSKQSRSSSRMIKRRFGVANITVVGVGGGGCNTVMRLVKDSPIGINFVCVNTDMVALNNLSAGTDGIIVLPIGKAITRGFGAGGNPLVGEQAVLSGRSALKQVLSGSDIAFITTGLGGGTGTGAAPVVAEIAKNVGALTVAMVTLPFSWEGQKRMETALNGLARLREKADNLILVHNDLISNIVPEETEMRAAFKAADESVAEGILVVNEIVNTPGDINVDLADIRAIMALPGNSLMSIGQGRGVDAAADAVRKAVKNPLLDASIDGAKGILFTVKGGSKVTLGQVNDAGRLISQSVDREAMIFFGMVVRPEMGDSARVTLIATGIPERSQRKGRGKGPQVQDKDNTSQSDSAGYTG